MRPIYLLCGVPGSGKTWVAKQVAKDFLYLPHDDHEISSYARALITASRKNDKPVLGEAPFRISVLIDELKRHGANVKTYFVIESADVVKSRYETREKKPIPKQHLTRIKTVKERARQYQGKVGTSEEVLRMIKAEMDNKRIAVGA